MRLTYLLLSVVVLCATSSISQAQNEQFIVAGCGLNKVAVINRAGDILWSAPVSNSDCNDAQVTNEGNVLYVNGLGAHLIGRDKKVIWSQMAKANEEIHSAFQQKNGEYVLAFSGHPARIVELSKSGDIVKEVKFETGVENVHSQFRQVSKTKSGNYVVPIVATGVIFELDGDGELLRKIDVGGTPFQVNVISKKEWLVAGGDGNYIATVDVKSGEVVRKFEKSDVEGCRLLFVGEAHVLKNGNVLFANWSGHNRNDEPQPMIAEINDDNELVWSLDRSDLLNIASSVSPIAKKHNF